LAPETAHQPETTFDSRTELKSILNLGWPIVMTQLFVMLTGTIDAALAGHYSSTDLAGVSLGGMVRVRDQPAGLSACESW